MTEVVSSSSSSLISSKSTASKSSSSLKSTSSLKSSSLKSSSLKSSSLKSSSLKSSSLKSSSLKSTNLASSDKSDVVTKKQAEWLKKMRRIPDPAPLISADESNIETGPTLLDFDDNSESKSKSQKVAKSDSTESTDGENDEIWDETEVDPSDFTGATSSYKITVVTVPDIEFSSSMIEVSGFKSEKSDVSKSKVSSAFEWSEGKSDVSKSKVSKNGASEQSKSGISESKGSKSVSEWSDLSKSRSKVEDSSDSLDDDSKSSSFSKTSDTEFSVSENSASAPTVNKSITSQEEDIIRWDLSEYILNNKDDPESKKAKEDLKKFKLICKKYGQDPETYFHPYEVYFMERRVYDAHKDKMKYIINAKNPSVCYCLKKFTKYKDFIRHLKQFSKPEY